MQWYCWHLFILGNPKLFEFHIKKKKHLKSIMEVSGVKYGMGLY